MWAIGRTMGKYDLFRTWNMTVLSCKLVPKLDFLIWCNNIFLSLVKVTFLSFFCLTLNLSDSSKINVLKLQLIWYQEFKITIHLVIWYKVYIKRRIQRTQTSPLLWPLTLTCDLELTSRSRKLMSLNVAYCIVPWSQVWCLWK